MCVLSACTSHSLQNAQGIVVKADSLWKVGQIYEDSTQLARAYKELRYWQWMYPDEYVHACYHYGRLLRQKEDPVAAMQVFINATHSRTHDYHFLGRAYNNIGDMCHRAGEYALSYDMFEQSANMYLRDGDTLSYYYCLNDMALEMAEQGKRDSCFALLKHIYNSHTSDNILLAYCLHSQAQAYIICSQFDSAIVYANLSRQYIPSLSATLLQLAQAYSFLGEKDSAAFYAHQVLSMTEELYEINNALYILTNDDATKDMQSVRQTAADRSDTQKMIENHKYKLSQAVQLLEQDLTHKQSWIWLYIVVASFLIMGSIIEIYIYKKRKKHRLLSQKIKDLETTETQTLAQMRKMKGVLC